MASLPKPSTRLNMQRPYTPRASKIRNRITVEALQMMQGTREVPARQAQKQSASTSGADLVGKFLFL